MRDNNKDKINVQTYGRSCQKEHRSYLSWFFLVVDGTNDRSSVILTGLESSR